jgi:SulP family sulfate permease
MTLRPVAPESDPHARFEPKLLTVLREGYSAQQFLRDLLAGLQVGIVALPLSIALAIASGVRPEQGLYTAIVAGFLISLLGGSRVQIGGPTGAFIVIVYGVVQKFGYPGLAVATMMAGGILVVMGLARLGSVIKFVPYPVTVGFTSGIALIIAAAQVRDLFGLQLAAVPADFVEKLAAYAGNAATWSPWALGVGLATLAILVFFPRITRRIPAPLLALLVATAAVQWFGIPVETIADRFGAVPHSLPRPAIPTLPWHAVRELFPSALAIAILAGIESLLAAVVSDGMTGGRHRSNTELVAQGIANIASPRFGGIPATGAIARIALNVKSGGRTPIAGIVHALTVLAILIAFANAAGMIPLAALGAILLMVAYHMSEWRVFVRLFRSPRSDVLVLLTTFLLTVLVDLTVALQAGMVLAAFLFMKRMSDLSQAGYVRTMIGGEAVDDRPAAEMSDLPPGVEVFEVHGALFFGAVSKFNDAMRRVEKPPSVLILRLSDVLAMDATGLRAIEDVFDKARRDGTSLVLSGVHAQPMSVLARAGMLERIGEDNIAGDFAAAMARARQLMDSAHNSS